METKNLKQFVKIVQIKCAQVAWFVPYLKT